MPGDKIMNGSGQNGRELTVLIARAMKDGKVTDREFDEIMALANADEVIDVQERRLLSQLEQMIESKVVVRVSED
jgi:hypothetical protein